MQPNTLTLLRSQEARAVFGNLPTSTFYEWIERGLMSPGVAIGIRSVAWPHHELQAIAAARIAGKQDKEIKALVRDLVAARPELMKEVAA